MNTFQSFPSQHQQKQPGIEQKMNPLPDYKPRAFKSSGKMERKIALITGGDSGIGRAVALLFAYEGADISIVYLEEHEDAKRTCEEVQALGRKCLLIPGDLTKESFCKEAVQKTIQEFGKIDCLVNNAAEQHDEEDFEKITYD